MSKISIVGGYQDIRSNGEDFILTPYLFLVNVKGEIIQVYGLGLGWGYYAVFFGLGLNIPKGFPHFRKCNEDIKVKKV